MYEDISSFRGTGISSRVYCFTYTVSAVIHVLFFAAFIFMPRFGLQPYQMPRSISVSLVSLPGKPELSGLQGSPKSRESLNPESEPEPPAVTEKAEPEPVQEPEPEPAPEPEPEPEPEPAEPPPVPIQPEIKQPKETVVIPDAPEKKEKPEIKPEKNKAPEIPEEQIVTKKKNPQTQKPKDAQKEVVKPSEAKHSEAKSDAARSESIKDAVERIRASVGKKGGQKGGGRSGDGGNSDSPGRPGGGRGGMSGPMSDIYASQLAYQIEQNWAFSPSLAGGRRDLKSILLITILPDGHIQNIEFEQRSGNNYLDESAYRAVVKSNPLPPLPKGYSEYTVALVFTPSGLN